MNTNQDSNANLPLGGTLTLIYALSFFIAILMAAASIAGLLCQTTIYPSDELLQSFLPTDVTILFIGLPMLLGSMWLARRGKTIGLLLWPGALFFPLYTYLTYVLAMPLSVAFLLHLTIVAMSVYTLVALLASIDAEAVQRGLDGSVPNRLAGGILAGLGALFLLRAIVVMVSALTAQAPMAETEFALNTSDYLTAPTWVVGGVLLWRRKALGFVAGLGLLFQASMLFIALIVVLLMLPLLANTQFALVDTVVVFVMGFICFVPFALFARGVVSDSRP